MPAARPTSPPPNATMRAVKSPAVARPNTNFNTFGGFSGHSSDEIGHSSESSHSESAPRIPARSALRLSTMNPQPVGPSLTPRSKFTKLENSGLRTYTRTRPNLHGVERPIRYTDVTYNKIVPVEEEVVQKKKDLAAGPELDKRRSLIAGELLATEESYVNELKRLVHVVRVKLYEQLEANSSKFMGSKKPRELLDSLFSNVTEILPLNEKILQGLSERYRSWDSQTLVGDILLHYAPSLKIYTEYSNNYEQVPKLLDNLFELEWFAATAPNRYEMTSMLIQPIQRLPRYRMLVQDLLQHTLPNHPDDGPLSEALVSLKAVASHVNASIREFHNTEVMRSMGISYLASPTRNLVINGVVTLAATRTLDENSAKPLTSVNKPYELLLFNDVLVFMKQSMASKMKQQEQKGEKSSWFGKVLSVGRENIQERNDVAVWPLELVWFSDIDGDDQKFLLIGPTKEILIETTEKKKWTGAISRAIKDMLTLCDMTPDSGLPMRIGRYNFSGFEVYDGAWELGRMHGWGSYTLHDMHYEGEWEDTQRSGFGVMEYNDGTLYKGEWANGKPHGNGETISISGDKYKGSWVNGVRCGKGVAVFKGGDKYSGEWRNNLPEGEGELLTICPFSVYKGQFLAGQFHGKGTRKDKEGVYEGNFENGKRSGEGVFTYEGGKKTYTGEFKADVFSGAGKLATPDWTYTGSFKNGLFYGRGKKEWTVGNVYEGNWTHGVLNGKGSEYSPIGPVVQYVGDYVNGVRQGSGEITYTNKDKYVGFVANGNPHGSGKYYFKATESVIEGKFNNGCFEGKFEVSGTTSFSVDSEGCMNVPCGGKSHVAVYIPPPMIPNFYSGH
eukprot:TRINITY_DN671_c2_g2_i3.p1 TRINITY_DN671_c2_g2~~TRINITY_DN671_c2_g2_i3.p1  ORF type:complete len:842 (+),score=187.36 TRINITY_DN671_c2_g2_i3:611-3136(+)